MGEFSSARSEGTRVGPVVLGPAIGQGGEGIIYLGEHDVLGQVAVKEFYPSLMASRDESKLARAANPSWQKQFRDGVDKFVDTGARLIKLDPHQNILRFHEVFNAEGTAYLVMQLIAGQSLARAIDQGVYRDPKKVLELADCLSSALVHLHKAKLWHRDIAPDNLLIRASDEQIYLIDFNAAKDLVLEVTQSSQVLHKPGFSPCEQYWGGAEQLSPTTDIYAASAVLYNAVAGKRPVESIKRQNDDTLEPLTRLAAGRFPSAFLAAIDHGMAVKAEDRPQSAQQWRTMLGFGKPDSDPIGDDHTRGSPHLFDHQPPPLKAWIKFVAIAAALCVLVLGTGYAVGFWPFGSTDSAKFDPTSPASDGADAAAAQPGDLAWQAGKENAAVLVPGVWIHQDGPSDAIGFKSDDFDNAKVSMELAFDEASKKSLGRKTYSAANFPFGPAAFEQLRFGTQATFYVDGDQLRSADATMFQTVSKTFGDIGGKHLTATFALSDCVEPMAQQPTGTVFRAPCLKLQDAKGKSLDTEWDLSLKDNTGTSAFGKFRVEKENGWSLTFPSNDPATGSQKVDDLGNLVFSVGTCAMTARVPVTIKCDFYFETADATFTTELRVTNPGEMQGRGTLRLKNGAGPAGSAEAKLSNPVAIKPL